jgi:hypothetical protein
MFKILSGDLVTLDYLRTQRSVTVIDPDTGEYALRDDAVLTKGLYYAFIHPKEVPDWVDESRLDWISVCKMPQAIRLIEQNPGRVFWSSLSINPAAIHLFDPEKVTPIVSCNPNAIDFLYENPDLIYPMELWKNPSPRAVELYDVESLNWGVVSQYCSNLDFLQENIDRIDWFKLSSNVYAESIAMLYPERLDWIEVSLNPGMMNLIREYPARVSHSYILSNTAAGDLIREYLPEEKSPWIWDLLCSNPSAVGVMREYKENIVWHKMCRHPLAIDLIKEMMEKRVLTKQEIGELCSNPAAVNLLERYRDKLCYRRLSSNPVIYMD